MGDAGNESEIIERFRASSASSSARAPLNSALSAAIARDRSLASLLAHAPAEQQLPVFLLAAIHHLVLDEPQHHLADWYPNLRTEHLAPDDPTLPLVLADFVHERSSSVSDVLATRRVQTNEIGRCAFLLPGLSAIGDEVGPLAHVDVGASAGLNTLLSHYSYRYDDRPVLGTGGPLLECSTRGNGAVPSTLPHIASSRGIDINPMDVGDPDDARWLMACCWPDQTDRFERLAAAIDIARAHPPTLVRGDAVEVVASTITEVAADGHPMLTSSWVMNYLEPTARHAFLRQLDLVGEHTDLSWLFAESPSLTPELPHADQSGNEDITSLTLVRWRNGERSVQHLGTCHPHGYWIHWT